MNVKIIEGRSGTGKTTYIINSMVEKINDGKKCFLVVPDAMTYEAEYKLMKNLGGGLVGAEVLSLHRLAQKVLSNAGGITRQFLSDEGKIMVFRKIIDENKNSLNLYASSSIQSGFAEIISAFVSSLKSAEISPSELLALSESISDKMLKNKLDDISVLYKAFEEFMTNKYIDSEDHMSLLIERLPHSEMFKDSYVYFDGFNSTAYTEQFMSLFIALSHLCNQVQISMRVPEIDDADYSYFEKQVMARVRIIEMFREIFDYKVERINLSKIAYQNSRKMCDASIILEHSLFSYDNDVYNSEAISCYKASNPREEVEQAAAQIDKLLRSGSRANDIAIALGDMGTYSHLLRKHLRNIPLHMDEKRALDSHPIVSLTLAAIKSATSGIDIDDLINIGKSGFAPVSVEEIEALEAYCNKFGLKYNTIEKDDYFFRGSEKEPDLFQLAKNCRDSLLSPLLRLRLGFKSSKLSIDYCKALFLYYEEMQTRQILENFCKKWEDLNEFDIAAENSQVWNAILELLDQIALLLVGEMTSKRFALVLQEGFYATKIGMIPSTPDQISIGDISKQCLRDNILHLIVLGCNEGMMPSDNDNAQLIDDDEIDSLAESGMDKFRKTDHAYSNQREEIYALFARAEKSIYLSWSTNDSKGNKLFPSRIAERITAMFPESIVKHYAHDSTRQIGKREALSRVISEIRGYLDNDADNDLTAKTFAYLKNDHESQNLLEKAESRLFALPISLDANASPLFTRTKTEAVTKVEQFNSCPFKHFVSYGLRADERTELKMQNIDIGNVYHKVIDLFTKYMIENNASWKELEMQTVESIVDELISSVIEDYNEGVFLQTAKNRNQVRKMRLTLIQTLWAIITQINSGEFLPLYSEAAAGVNLPYIEITLSGGEKVKLMGKIDRVDVASYDDHQMIRIVDYKSGSMNFSFEELYYGVKLQLPLYLHAASKLGIPSGMFYLHVKNVERKNDPDEFKQDEIQPQYRLQGLMVADEKVIKAMDSEFESKSEVIPVNINKDGEMSSSTRDFMIPLDQMNIVIDYSVEKTGETIQQIRNGICDVLPIKSKNIDSCKFCNYSSICRFEYKRNSKFRSTSKMDSETFFDILDQ